MPKIRQIERRSVLRSHILTFVFFIGRTPRRGSSQTWILTFGTELPYILYAKFFIHCYLIRLIAIFTYSLSKPTYVQKLELDPVLVRFTKIEVCFSFAKSNCSTHLYLKFVRSFSFLFLFFGLVSFVDKRALALWCVFECTIPLHLVLPGFRNAGLTFLADFGWVSIRFPSFLY